MVGTLDQELAKRRRLQESDDTWYGMMKEVYPTSFRLVRATLTLTLTIDPPKRRKRK